MFRSTHQRTILVATLTGCLAAAGTAFAQTQSVTPPPSTSPGAQSMTPPPSTSPGASTSPINMPSAVPSKSETATSAFDKLGTSRDGFVSKENLAKVDGFDRAFTEADRNKDGKLSREEFTAAWAIYTGRS